MFNPLEALQRQSQANQLSCRLTSKEVNTSNLDAPQLASPDFWIGEINTLFRNFLIKQIKASTPSINARSIEITALPMTQTADGRDMIHAEILVPKDADLRLVAEKLRSQAFQTGSLLHREGKKQLKVSCILDHPQDQ